MTDSARGMAGRLALGRYRVVRELARGGMGMLYLGRVEGAAGFSKPVVIKRVLSQADEGKNARAQFIREARLLSELHHPNIVGVIDFGEEDDGYLMILEYVHGFHVGLWLRYVLEQGRKFHWEFAALIVIKVLAALHYAHNRIGPDGKKSPIIHRDVSPGNVLIDLQGSVRLLDFGIARAADDEEGKTQTGVVKGKLPFIAPEIYRSSDASPVSDVYSTGVMLYQLLSGKNPFSAKDMSAIIGRVLDFTPPPISTTRNDLPAGVDAVLARALEKDPKKRYPSAQEFSNALLALLTCSEAELVDELRAAVAIEFSDEMATALHVPALSELDSAWRAAAENPESIESLQHSSFPPEDGDTHTAMTQPLPLQGSVPKSLHDHETVVAPLTARAHAEQMRAPQPGTAKTSMNRDAQKAGAYDQVTVRPAASPATLGDPNTGSVATTTTGEHPAQSSRSMIAILVGAALVAAAVLGAAMVLRGGKVEETPRPPRFLVVERPGDAPSNSASGVTTPMPAPSPAPSATAAAVPPVRPNAGTNSPNGSGALGKPSSSPKSDAERVTAAFGARQSAVQRCFSQAASGISGAPQVTVHFAIGADGAVRSATIAPAAIANTALGSCLLSVAQGTTFPALGKNLNFSIPITAQVVPRK